LYNTDKNIHTMKKPIMIIAALMLLIMPMMAERVTPETARKVATTFLQNNGAKTTQMVDLSESAGFENLYIFTTESSFVVMSADDCVKPILGYSFEGGFVATGMPENLVWWLQGYNRQIQDAIDSQTKGSSDVAIQWENLKNGNTLRSKTRSEVGPLLSTKWDQTYPYNYYCPTCNIGGSGGHVYTGCVATAMAQVIKHHEKPIHGISSHSYTHATYGYQYVNFSETNYDWDNMPVRVYSNSSQTQINAVATLMYHCGVAVDMDYGYNGSGAFSANIAPALINYFNYSQSTSFVDRSNYSDENWIALMRQEISNNRPVIYGGLDSATNPQSGHSFVCDGYGKDGYSNYYFNFNWGWSGSYNGYYSIDNMTPGGSGAGGGNHNYSYLQDAVIGIQPSPNNAIPTNLTYTISGLQNLTLNWTIASSEVSYNIYRNGNLVGNTTATSFSEVAPFGSNIYWVRSVDANGELSLPSNSISVLIDYQTPIVNDLEAAISGNNAELNWTAPVWCYPETESGTLTYGNGTYYSSLGYGGSALHMYWGHRYPASILNNYNGKVIYKISLFVSVTGSYQCLLYKGTSSYNYQETTYYLPVTPIGSVSFTASQTGWINIDLGDVVAIDSSQDLWIYMYDPEYKDYPASFCLFSEHTEGCYYTSGDPRNTLANNYGGTAFLIKAYLSDGTYTYNLYQDGTAIVENLNSTTYNATLNDNAANLFTVKTNYYAGETDASNKVGFAKGSASLNGWEMAANDQMTLTEGSTLTVSGDLINSNPDNLILENGAQLIHNTEGVKATVKKDIIPYTGDNGWNFIASPITEALTPSEENGFLNGTVGQGNNTYDLYYYDEPSQQWKNYESQSFVIENKKGYLYANGETNGTTLQFSGTLSPSNESITINNLSHSATTLNGFNLVGNPFACNATINQDCYVIEGSQVVLATTAPVLAPCEGVMVKATNECSSVTFTKTSSSKGNNSKDCFDLVIIQGKANVDRARVRLNEGIGMEKFSLNDKHSQISLWQDGQDFAVAYVNGATEMPVTFSASKDGTYTLTLEASNLDLDYLHLIDNLTGNDVDLLVTPSYTFEAKTTDYTSRFRLVFSNYEDTVGDNVTFAYVNNGDIVVNEEGTLQIVDMTGRVIVSRSGRIQCVPTTGMASGVYVLRLINTDGVKTQKIVVE